MRDLIRILDAFDALAAETKPAALVTLVAVAGSSFRQAGARMLITADGQTVGAISGGCLERDVARRARGVIDSGRPVVCAYETTGDVEIDSDQPDQADAPADPGTSLGCGGSVEVLIQRVTPTEPGPMAAIASAVRQRRPSKLATVFRVGGPIDVSITATLQIAPDDRVESTGIPNPTLRQSIQNDLQSIPGNGPRACPKHYVLGGGWADVLLERLAAPQQIVIFGDGLDVEPLVEMAKTLAWHVTVVGWRAEAAMQQRFKTADRLVCIPSAEALAHAADLDREAAAVVMTHNLRRDAAVLRHLLSRLPRYVGVLGPRHRTDRLLTMIGFPAGDGGQLFAPIGLDLGAEAPEQIALSILAEIQSALSGHGGGPLRDRAGSIHSHRDPLASPAAAPAANAAGAATPTASSPISCPQ